MQEAAKHKERDTALSGLDFTRLMQGIPNKQRGTSHAGMVQAGCADVT